MTKRLKRLAGALPILVLLLALLPGLSLTAYADEAVIYPLWVGDTQVTEENAVDETGERGWSYAVDTNTLTLSGIDITTYYTKEDDSAGIWYEGDDALNIVLSSDNTINPSGSDSFDYGIESAANGGIELSGDGSLTVKAFDAGINTEGSGNIVISGGTITATGDDFGGFGINSEADVLITGGTVNAAGEWGIAPGNDKCVTIGENATVTSTGTTTAIVWVVKNAAAGTGWEDTSGTRGKQTIAVSHDGQLLSSYKKVRFPAAVDVTGVSLYPNILTLTVGDGPVTLSATVSPENATDKRVTWASDNEAVAAVDSNGVVTARSAGTAVITVATVDGGKSATCAVTVSAPTAYCAYQPRSTDDDDALAARQVSFNGYPWYIIADNSTGLAEGTLTLLAADTSFGTSVFNTNNSLSYNSSTVKSMLDALTETGGSFAGAAKAIRPVTLTTYQYGSNTQVYETTENAKLYLLSVQEALALPQNVLKLVFPNAVNHSWWLRSPGEIVNSYGTDLYFIAGVLGDYGLVLASTTFCQRALGVRPALKLDLSAVVFSSESKTFLLPQTITAPDVTVTYGDTDKSVSAETDGDGAISYAVKEGSEGYIDVDASTGALTVKQVPADGKAYVTVTAAEKDAYGTTTKDVTVTINRAESAAASVAANDRGYDAAEQPLVTVTGAAAGGTMYYALGTDAATAPADNLYTTSVPSAADAGTYYVWYKLVGDGNHTDIAAACVTVRIIPFGPASFTLPAATKTLGESAFEGDTSVTIVDAQLCAALGANAFKGCTNLTQLRLPKDCSIDATAFTGCTGLSGIFAPAGGTTETWCKNNGVAFFAEQPDA